MAWIVARIADGRLRASRWDRQEIDPATHVQFEAPEMPDPLTQRWDGATGVRDATAQELADAAAADADREAIAAIDAQKALKALALVVGDLTSQTPAQMRARFLAKYKTL